MTQEIKRGMSDYEWRCVARRLRAELKAAKQAVYPGQCEFDKEECHERLRKAEDALQLHIDNKDYMLS